MKGYFSQLARRTGLHFPNAARPQAPALGSQHPSPLHVEEVTFVPLTPTALAPDKPNVVQPETSQPAQATQTHAAEPSTPLSFSAASSAEIQLSEPPNEHPKSTATSIETENVQLLSTEHQSPFPGRNVERDQIFEMPVDEVPLERVEARLGRSTPDTTSSSPQEAQAKPEPPAQTVDDLDPRDPVQREVLVRQYLREVRAWVAAPPIPIADVPENEIVEERQSTTAWQPESVAIVERESPTAKQPTQRDHIDVHETSLSIGSISVIIEDPKPAVTTIAPTPSAPSAPRPQPQPEPTSLSRYYLQRW